MARPLWKSFILCLFLAVPCFSSGAQAEDAKQLVSVKGENTPLRKLLANTFLPTVLRFEVQRDVPDVPLTLQLRNVSPEVALRVIVRAAATADPLIEASLVDGKYLIRLQPFESLQMHPMGAKLRDPRLAARRRLELRGVDVQKAFEHVLAGTNVAITFSDLLPRFRISLPAQEASTSELLWLTFEEAWRSLPDLSLQTHLGVYQLGIRPRQQVEPESLRVLRTRKVTASLKDATLQQVVNEIMTGSGLQYSFHPNLTPVKLSLELQDVTLEEAFRRVTAEVRKQAPEFSIGYDGPVFVLENRRVSLKAKPGEL